MYARVYSTPDGHLRYLFLSCDVEVSYVSNHQKQALVNAIILCLLPHPERSPIEVGEAASA